MADTNTTTLVGKLTNIADGFRISRSLTETLSLDEMATLAAVPVGGENKLAQLVDKTITEITAGDLAGITTIGTFAFTGCVNLTNVTIPDTVITIGNNAFTSCTSLTSIIIPNSVLEMGSNMFQYCSALTTAVIGNSIQTLGSSMFSNCTNLTSVTIGNRVQTIGSSAFNTTKKLTSLTIPASVTRIKGDALTIGSSTGKATITFLRTTPPTIQKNSFNVDYLNKIIVPVGCGEAYRTATNWANFADFIEEAAV